MQWIVEMGIAKFVADEAAPKTAALLKTDLRLRIETERQHQPREAARG